MVERVGTGHFTEWYSGSDVVLQSTVVGDAYPRLKITADGVVATGAGAAAPKAGQAALTVAEGTNATMGTATLVTGTKVVSTTAVTANSRIFLTVQSLGTVTAPTMVAVTARTAGTSFTITSADATDTSVVAWVIVEPR
jgi:hypothetical protein